MRHYGETEDAAKAEAKAAASARMLEAVQHMHDAIAQAKDVVYGTSSVETLSEVALVLGGVTLGPLLGMTAAAITAWIYSDRPSTEEVKESIVNALNSLDRGVVGRLHGEIPQVLAGAVPIEKWLAAYQEVIKGVAMQLDELHETTLATHLRQEKEAIVRSIKAAAAGLAEAAQVVGKYVVSPLLIGLGVVAGLFILNQLAPVLPSRRR